MFGGRRRALASNNEAHALVPFFTPDPHGAAMFGTVIDANSMGGARPVIDARGDAYGGAMATSPQRDDMTGASYLGGGRPVVPPTTALHQERGMVSDPVQRIFEQRAAARRFE